MCKKFVFTFLIVLGSLAGISQSNSLTVLESGLKDYRKNFPLEKLYVHTDKNFYTAGEMLWFKVYNCTDSTNKAVVTSKVVYVEILDKQNNAILQAKISMNENSGEGSFELPLAMNTGNYNFRAYTSWMKNFGAEHFFEKKIAIVNPFKSISAVETTSFRSIDLFPEGGNLVNGILSQVAFEITRNDGPIPGKGYVIDENNDTVTKFEPFKFGLGSFYLTPDIRHQYKAVYVFNDNTFITKPLPEIFAEGYVMHLDEENQNIRLTVHSNNTAASPIYLVVQNHQNIKVAKQSSLVNNIAVFSIDKTDLGAGVSQLTVFNEARQPVCERLFFIQPSNNTKIETAVAKDVYTNREKVVLNISSPSSTASNLSVSVFQFDSLQKADDQDIKTYLWLESELNGTIKNPQYYLSGQSEEIRKATDNLMLTHGWRRFNWDNVLHQPSLKFEPDNLGQTIVCRVTDSATGKPAKGIKILLSIPESSYKLFPGISDDSGIVHIRANEYFGKGELILQTVERNDSHKIEAVKPFAEEFTTFSDDPLSISESEQNVLENHSIGMQSQYIYSNDSIQKFFAPVIKDSLPFYGRGESIYMLDDYVRFVTMEEVLREYVREINVGAKGGSLNFKLLNSVQQEYFSNNILVMVDGVPLDPDKIFKIDPMKIRRIDIIPRSYVLGTSLFFGLANFSTYKETHEDIDIDPKAVVVDYEGLQIKREFYSPDYSEPEQFKSRIPDLRNTLYWSSNITANQQVQFYTGDNKGKYLVVVEGLNNNHEPVSAISQFEVK